ncbi:hypothetical protein MFIFM68171_00555 [Madurella fahalii]|uniref:Uncharacterized protein n=1 Tax=Madurella fahalii TaxID=1157608 RepID=A0ABQ0FXY0_9PEZI
MNPRQCFSFRTSKETGQDSRRQCWASEALEIGIAALCSTVTWEYTVQNELPPGQSESLPEQHVAEMRVSGFLFQPSPGLMLFSCLVFGCCVSSFTHRRQSQDAFQFAVYVVLLAGAAIAGYAVGANVHLILLGYIPWATCAAMATSIAGHGLYRWLRPNVRSNQGDEEKAPLVG